jgi:hypothetical protein
MLVLVLISPYLVRAMFVCRHPEKSEDGDTHDLAASKGHLPARSIVEDDLRDGTAWLEPAGTVVGPSNNQLFPGIDHQHHVGFVSDEVHLVGPDSWGEQNAPRAAAALDRVNPVTTAQEIDVGSVAVS